MDLINATDPDLICFTGDLVSLRLEELTPYIGTLGRLKADHGVCSVLGNHDFFIYSSQYHTDMEKIAAVDSLAEMQRSELGWHLLRNESFTITRGADTDIPLTLSGHTHCAQIRLFGWTPASWVFNETCGRYDRGDQTLYVNIGLGCTAPVRLGADPEITVITLKRK